MKDFLFWLHLSLIIGYIFLGVFFSFWVVAAVTIAHRLHYKIFNGCVLSKWQKRIKAIPEDLGFIQDTAQRICKRQISKHSAKIIDWLIAVGALSVALIANFVK